MPGITENTPFNNFKETFRVYEDGKAYNEFQSSILNFDAKILELENIYDKNQILEEMNKISRQIFIYGAMIESQSRIVQILEDEYSKWYAEKYLTVQPSSKSDKMTEKNKEFIIMSNFKEEYDKFQKSLRDEKYRLGILKRVLGSLESFSYKLHAFLNAVSEK